MITSPVRTPKQKPYFPEFPAASLSVATEHMLHVVHSTDRAQIFCITASSSKCPVYCCTSALECWHLLSSPPSERTLSTAASRKCTNIALRCRRIQPHLRFHRGGASERAVPLPAILLIILNFQEGLKGSVHRPPQSNSCVQDDEIVPG